MSQVNKQWFQERLADRKLSQRGLAKLLGMDASSLSLLLSGKRRMKIEQAAEIARLLNVPVETVMKHGGADVRTTEGIRKLPLVGWIDGAGNVSMDWTKTDTTVAFDCELPGTAGALQYRTAQTPADMNDGWLAAILPPREPDETQMLDRFCIVGLKGGQTLARKVRRGYTPGRHTLIAMFAEPIHDAEIAWFSPVVLIRPI